MRIYTLQIHTNPSDAIDEIYSFADIENLYSEFKNKFNFYKCHAKETISEEQPFTDEDGSLNGGFCFGNEDGSFTIGKVYDYDILDED